MRALLGGADRGPVIAAAFVFGALAVLTLTVLAGFAVAEMAPLVGLFTIFAVAYRSLLGWPSLLAGLALVIFFIPIKRYSLPGNLPFELEPYRLYVAVIAALWLAALLVDPRVRLRASGLEPPLFLFSCAALGSVIFNGDRITELQVDAEVTKQLTFFASFVLVFYLIVSVVRTREQVDFLVKMLVGSGAALGFLALVESNTGYNVFDHLDSVIPLLQGQETAEVGTRGGKVRVVASSQHSIALGAAFAMLLPFAAYLGFKTRQYRWWAAAAVLSLGALATMSRTSVVMGIVIIGVLLWLRPTQTKRFWPALLPALVVVHLALPGTIGTLRNSFFPEEGLLAQQSENAGQRGSGRVADLGPALDEYSQQPVFGQGFGTRITGRDNPNAQILDNQWLKTLLETGLVGAVAWFWIFGRSVRRLSRRAKADRGEGGFIYVAFSASILAFAVGMFFYDAFSFIQTTFVLFILLALGCASLAAREKRPKAQPAS